MRRTITCLDNNTQLGLTRSDQSLGALVTSSDQSLGARVTSSDQQLGALVTSSDQPQGALVTSSHQPLGALVTSSGDFLSQLARFRYFINPLLILYSYFLVSVEWVQIQRLLILREMITVCSSWKGKT